MRISPPPSRARGSQLQQLATCAFAALVLGACGEASNTDGAATADPLSSDTTAPAAESPSSSQSLPTLPPTVPTTGGPALAPSVSAAPSLNGSPTPPSTPPAASPSVDPSSPSTVPSTTTAPVANSGGANSAEPSNSGGSAGDSYAAGGNPASGGSEFGGSPASAGASANGGSSANAGATATGGTPGLDSAGFTLLYRDDFNSLDMNRWQLMTHSWESNLALFSANTVTAADGFLTLRLMDAPAGTVDDTGASKPYLGAEVRSRDTLTYGRVRTRAKLARGSAVVSALVTIYTPWPADNWNELDIECLGAEPNNVQFNAMVYTGPPPPMPLTASVTPTQDPLKVDLGFDPSADFHVFTMEWTPEAANFYVDDVLLRSWTQNIALMVLPQNVLMTIWASSAVDWAGAVTAETNTASVVYDWIELYEYAAP